MKAVLLAAAILLLVLVLSAKDADVREETGIASWYGYPYHGRQAADGEVYDMEKLTAAHRTLPFGTWVRVVNLRNQKAVEVRITDRGPFIDGRIIDLSKAAARSVDMLESGVEAVRLEVIDQPTEDTLLTGAAPKSAVVLATYGAATVRERSAGDTLRNVTDCFAVQVGAFQDQANARRVLARMQSQYGSGRIVAREGTPTLWRVLVGSEVTQEGAISLAVRIRQESTEGTAFVARVVE